MLGHGIRQRQRHRGAIALNDVARTLVDRGLQGVQTFCRAELVVDGGDLEFHAGRIASAAELLGKELVTFELTDADRSEQPGQRVDANHLDDLALLGKGTTDAQDGSRDSYNFQGKLQFELLGLNHPTGPQRTGYCALHTEGFPLARIAHVTGLAFDQASGNL